MPEGDTIFRAAQTMHRVLAGHAVTKFETAYAHLDRVNVDTPIVGRIIEKCESVGKHHLIVLSGDLVERIDDMEGIQVDAQRRHRGSSEGTARVTTRSYTPLVLRTHMRMSGSWHLYRHGERWWRGPQAMRVRIDTADWVAVAFDVPVAEFVTSKQLATRDPVAQLGPDLLGSTFDRDEALRRIVGSGARPIAMTLLDQRILAGIGNVYKSEVLFMAGVHPDTPSSAVPVAMLERMLDVARGVLRDNVVEGTAPSIQTYRNLRQWNPASEHDESVWVYGRRGKPCRKCGTPIESKKMGIEARTTYWCPNCQPIRYPPM